MRCAEKGKDDLGNAVARLDLKTGGGIVIY